MDRSNFYNVIHLSLSFFFIFTSYNVAQTFQTSSTYARDGAFAVGIIYLVFCVSNLALASYVTQLLSIRKILIVSSLTYVFFIASNIKFHQWILYICAFLLGIGAALLWTAQGVYVTLSINKHEEVNQLPSSSTRGFINGVFFGIFQMSQIAGNLIASLLFRLKFDQWIVFLVMTIIATIGSISLVFLRSIKNLKTEKKRPIWSSLSMLIDVRFILLIPSMCYNGLALGFIFGAIPPLIVDKSQKFLMFALFGGVNAFCCIGFGKLSDSIGRRLLILTFAAICHFVVFGLLLTIWIPPLDENRIGAFIVIIVFLSIGDAIIGTLLFSIIAIFYGKTRPADAFSCLKLFQAGSTAIGFAEQTFVSLTSQVYYLIVLLFVALITLVIEHLCVVSLDTGKTKRSVKEKAKKETPTEVEPGIKLMPIDIQS